MLTELAYLSIDEFESDYLEFLIAEALELAGEHSWWHESFALSASPHNPNLLSGSTKLMRRYIVTDDGVTHKINYRDDVLLGAVDSLALIEMLTLLSKEHEFGWNVLLPAHPRPKQIGRIENGEIDPRIFEMVLPEIEALEISQEELEDASLHQRLRTQYLRS